MPRPSDPRKLAVWRERLERFSSSGLAVGPFCAREGVSVASFYHWRKKVGRKHHADDEPRVRSARRPALGATHGPGRSGDDHPPHRTGPAEGCGRFRQVAVIPGTSPVPLTAPATRLPPGMLSIQLPGGTRMEVSAEDLDALRAVIAEVARADRAWEAPGRADCGHGVDTASC